MFVVVKDIRRREEFEIEKIVEYEYEVFGGIYVILVIKYFYEKFFENLNYNGRVVRIYIGLKDEEVLWLGVMYNYIGLFRY